MKMLRQKAKPTVTGLKMKRSGDTPGRPEYSGAFCGGWGGDSCSAAIGRWILYHGATWEAPFSAPNFSQFSLLN